MRDVLKFCLLAATLGCLSINSLWAAPKIEVYDPDEPLVEAADGSAAYQEMVVDAPSGDGSSETAPVKVYIPMDTGAGQANYTAYTGAIPDYDSVDTGVGQVRVRLKAFNDSGDKMYIYGVRKEEDGTWDSFALSGTYEIEHSNTTTYTVQLSFTLKNLCGTSYDECGSSLTTSTIAGERNGEMKAFFFLSDEVAWNGTDFDTSSVTGSYYTFYLSDEIDTGTDHYLTLQELKKGDQRLKAVFSREVSINYMSGYEHDTVMVQKVGTAVENYPGDCAAVAGDDIQTAIGAGATLNYNDKYQEDGEITLKNLTNGVYYYVNVALVNKFKFSSQLSTCRSQNTEAIETFLEKQSCYLISAGFQEEHYVLDYFRQFRDEVLLSFDFGERFIQWYYDTAPYFTHYIYESEWVSAIVRTFSYILYILMRYFLVVVLGVGILYIVFSDLVVIRNRK